MNVHLTKRGSLAGVAGLALALTAGCLPAVGGSGSGPGPAGGGSTAGRAPCAPAGSDGSYGPNGEHPERAPLLAERSFPGGVRWAICGASPVFDNGIVNVRSDDGGRTWTAHDTGIDPGTGFFHAGDRVDVEILGPDEATVHIVGRVAEIDVAYRTTVGGSRWRVVSCELIED